MSREMDITAVIYDKRGRVLSIGKNSYVKTHTLQARYAKKVGQEHRIFMHAEIHAISRCRSLSSAYRIMVSRFDAAGNPVNAKPCPICEEAIKSHTGIKVIEHT
jgi:tRNA(Arg) A34 adenosine deaminase TadA